MEKSSAIVFTDELLDTAFAKTCHGLLRGSDRFEVLAVIDPKFAGQDAGMVMDGQALNIPVYSSVEECLSQMDTKPTYGVVGVATPGGYLPDGLRENISKAIEHQLSIVNGLHTFLQDDPDLSAKAKEQGIQLLDIRKPRPRSELQFWNGSIYEVKAPRIAVMGMDCAIGKRTTCRFLMEMCRENGVKADMIYTGQTGWMQGYPHGFIFDSTLNDFISGELERAIVNCDQQEQPELILLEGQSALRNPTGPCGSEFLLSGAAKGVILQHAPGRECYEGTEEIGCHIPDIQTEIELIRLYGSNVLAVTLNEEHQTEEEMQIQQSELEDRLGIPVVRPLKEGVQRLLPIIKSYIDQQPA
ncbi:MAG: DUF1611 domain-containing protein [Saprospiraceae bacterium]|nr:DUF1611 domain-containing protein [Saprospiraceae bacterium]